MDFTENTLPFIGIAGLGLIGGSLAKAFKQSGYPVLAMDLNETVVAAAKNGHTADDASVHPSVLSQADYLFIALYPEATVDFVKKHFRLFKKNAVIVDCCGIKSAVCGELFPFSQENGFTFIGGHPMAGTEQNGFQASKADLFQNASFILTPVPGTSKETLYQLKKVIQDAGFGSIVTTTPQNHDRMIAFTSQLPHVIACAYVKSPCCPNHKGFSAGSFRDVSRVSHINGPMWAQLFIDNKELLSVEIDEFIRHLNEIKQAAQNEDCKTLTRLLNEARKIKDGV